MEKCLGQSESGAVRRLRQRRGRVLQGCEKGREQETTGGIEHRVRRVHLWTRHSLTAIRNLVLLAAAQLETSEDRLQRARDVASFASCVRPLHRFDRETLEESRGEPSRADQGSVHAAI